MFVHPVTLSLCELAGRICPCLTCGLALKPQHANVSLLSLKATSGQWCQAQQWLWGRLGGKACCAVLGCDAGSVLLAACSARSWLGVLSPAWMFSHCPRYSNALTLFGSYPEWILQLFFSRVGFFFFSDGIFGSVLVRCLMFAFTFKSNYTRKLKNVFAP